MKRAALAFFLVACGGEPIAPPKPPTPAPAELSQVVFALPKPADDVTARVLSAFEGALVNAGYKVSDGSAAYHFVLRPQVTTSVEPSFFHTEINGRVKQNLRYRIVLTILAKDQLVDQGATEFVADSEDPITEDKLTPLVNGLGRSERVKRAAAQIGQATTTNATAADERAWIDAKPEACRQPIKLDACDKVRLYIAEHNEGVHVLEAKDALAEAEPKLRRLQQDENAWQTADVEECARSRKCAAVELYLKVHPAGLHATEARKLLGR